MEPGIFQVANYETAQPLELAHETTPYSWIVETRQQAASDTGTTYIAADLQGRKGRARHRQAYFHGWSHGINHLDAAMEFMRVHILPANSHARLLCKASGKQGMLFVFL